MSTFLVTVEVNGGEYESTYVVQGSTSVEQITENSIVIDGSVTISYDEPIVSIEQV